MAELVRLSLSAHGALNLSPQRAELFAKGKHMLPLRVTEISQAISDFPVFISQMPSSDYALSALTSFEPGLNLFLENDNWDSSFKPVTMQTYPFYLMQALAGEEEPVLGLDPNSPALTVNLGEPLFSVKGKPSLVISQIKAQLMNDATNIVHTFEFFEALKSMGLIRALDISVKYSDETVQRIRGLHMIHEDKFHALSSDDFSMLRKKGYLGPIYALLFSVIQLNALIRRHNQQNSNLQISNINLEVSKDLSHS